MERSRPDKVGAARQKGPRWPAPLSGAARYSRSFSRTQDSAQYVLCCSRRKAGGQPPHTSARNALPVRLACRVTLRRMVASIQQINPSPILEYLDQHQALCKGSVERTQQGTRAMAQIWSGLDLACFLCVISMGGTRCWIRRAAGIRVPSEVELQSLFHAASAHFVARRQYLTASSIKTCRSLPYGASYICEAFELKVLPAFPV
jgi:hypothetical protein